MQRAVGTEPNPPVAPIGTRHTMWVHVGIVIAVLVATWIPILDTPLGDDWEGRLLSRSALQTENFWEDGPVASAFATSLEPYRPGFNYAHHPPLTNVLMVASTGLFGTGAWQLRIVPMAAAGFSLVMLAATLRRLGVRNGLVAPTLLFAAALPLFWSYARAGLGIAPLAATAWLLTCDQRTQRRWAVPIGAGAALASWAGLLAAGGAIIVLARQIRSVAARLAAGAIVGVVVSAAWILNATSIRELLGHAETRTFGGAFDLAEFAGQQATLTTEGMTLVGLVVALPATAYALSRRTARPAIVVVVVASLIVVAGLNQAAFTRSFFALPFVTALAIGVGVSSDALAARFESIARFVPIALILGSAVMFGWFVVSEGPYAASDRAADAAILLAETPKPDGLEVLYVDPGVLAPRWAAWQWDTRVTPYVTPEPHTVVFARYPIDPALEETAQVLAERGEYVVLTVEP